MRLYSRGSNPLRPAKNKPIENRALSITTPYGYKKKPHLPVTLDSVRVADRRVELEELTEGGWYIAKPKEPHGPLWRRVLHAWLVLTNRAMAVQFSRDHLEMAGVPVLPRRLNIPDNERRYTPAPGSNAVSL